MHVVIIGAGLVGICSAYALQKLGAKVTVIERREAAGLETSFANGALQHPSMVEPWNTPGVGWDLLRWLGRDDAPMLLHLSQMPSLSFWGLRFLAQSSPTRHRVNNLKNLRLALLSRREMNALRADTSVAYHWKKTGIIAVAREEAALTASRANAEFLAPHGINFRNLSRDETISLEPALAPIANVIAGSVYFTDEERADPFAFSTGLTEVLQSRGVAFNFNTTVNSIHTDGSRIAAVQTSAGDITGDAFVLAAGSFSPLIVRSLGIRIPVQPAKGYSATIRCKGNIHAPKLPVGDSWVHAAVTPVDDERIRVAGTAEFAGYDITVRQPRIDNLISLLGKIYPKLADSLKREDFLPWAGLRPMSCDGVPIVSPTRIANLFLNTGHGHIGWTTAAGSARLIADMIFERKPELCMADYSIDRF
jgi:D-amino-acid dehydrogenase